MDGIISFLFWIGFFILINVAMTYFKRLGKAVVSEGSFSENMEISKLANGQLKMRLVDKPIDPSNPNSPVAKEVEVIGAIPLDSTKKIGFVTSVLDVTSEETLPVVSILERFQENSSSVYQTTYEIGEVGGGQAFIKWCKVGVVLPGVLKTAYSGNRNLSVILRLIDLENPPPIRKGFHDPNDRKGMLWIQASEFNFNHIEKGYAEEENDIVESYCLALKIAVAIAYADGNFGDSEGEKIKEWMRKMLSFSPSSSLERLKNLYNEAFKEAYINGENGNLSLSDLTSRLNEIGSKQIKYQTMDLCFDVIGADGKWEQEELRLIKIVAEALNLDFSEFKKMKDQRLVNIDMAIQELENSDEILGIDKSWSNEEKKEHLRKEFQKWNNRITVLSEGTERENAQKMLDLIAAARKKCA